MLTLLNLKIELVFFVFQTSVYQYGAVDSGIATDGQIQGSDRSVTPFLTDLMDPTLCYVPNGYPSHAYYYGGKMIFCVEFRAGFEFKFSLNNFCAISVG